MPANGRLRTWFVSFIALDARSLALMRLATSTVLLYDLADRIQNLSAQYGLGSIFPPQIVESGVFQSPWPFLFTLMDFVPYLPLLLFTVAFVSALFLLLGWHTRLVSISAWASVLAIHLMDPLILNGGDVVMQLILFIGMFLPWGECFSLDSAFGNAKRIGTNISSLWTLALLVQLSCIYLFAGLEKSASSDWLVGTAVYHALSSGVMALPVGLVVLQFPFLMTAATFLVRYFQLSVVLFLFSPVKTRLSRGICFELLLGMHLSFALCLRVGIFSWISIALACALVPSEMWDRLAGILPQLREPTASTPTVQPTYFPAAKAMSECAALLFIAAVISWNVLFVAAVSPARLPAIYRETIEALGLSQYWDVFVPPPQFNGWYAVEGVLESGSSVNLFDPSAPLPLSKPTDIAAAYGRGRWMEYFITLSEQPNASTFARYYATYLCRQWNEDHAGASRVAEVSISLVGTNIGSPASAPLSVYPIVQTSCS